MKIINRKFGDLIGEWLDYKKFNVKETTYAQYVLNLNKYVLPYLKNIKVKKINKEFLYKYIEILSSKNISNKTIRDQLIIIKQILNYYDIDLVLPKIKIKYKEISIIKEYERKILVEYLVNDVEPDKLGIILSLFCGLRIGEVCALKWEDIDLNNNYIHINKTMARIKDNKKTKVIICTAKTKSGNRCVPIPESVVKIIKELKSNDNHYILTNTEKYIEPRTYSNKFKSILRKLKLNDYNYHALRHTFATLCMELGFDAKSLSEILGHSNITTTLQLYVHVNDKIKANNMNKIIINH